MYDFLGLRLHFKDELYTPIAVRDGWWEFHINFDDLLDKGLKLEAGIVVDSETGKVDIENLRHPEFGSHFLCSNCNEKCIKALAFVSRLYRVKSFPQRS